MNRNVCAENFGNDHGCIIRIELKFEYMRRPPIIISRCNWGL